MSYIIYYDLFKRSQPLIVAIYQKRVNSASYDSTAAGSAPLLPVLAIYRCKVYSVRGADALVQSAE